MGKKKKEIEVFTNVNSEEKNLSNEFTNVNIIENEITNVKEIDYKQLTKEEYDFLSIELPRITNYMPAHLMVKFWDLKNKIDGTKETRPCSCKSSGGHWKRCIQILRNYYTSIK